MGRLPSLFSIFMQLRFPMSFSLILVSTILFSAPSQCAPMPDKDSTESLLSLPYIQYVKTETAPNKIGTTIYKKDKVFPGYSIYTSDMESNGFVNLIDMDGTIVHRWKKNNKNENFLWRQVTPFPNGSILLTSDMTPIDWQRVDADSHTIAIYDMPGQTAHHGIYWLKEGGFLGLVQEQIQIPFQTLSLKVRNDSLVHVSPEGRTLKIIPLSKLLEGDPGYQKRLKAAYQRLKNLSRDKTKNPAFDIFHTNNIENLEWDIPGIAKKGDWLVTVRHLDRIFIVDPEQKKIVWQWGENIISRPHHATFLKGDQILLFDNGINKKSSRVIILDIRSKQIVWQYGQKPGQDFFSATRGSAQKLPNGNILIAESDKGRAFEVTFAGEIVWEWYNDFFTKGKHKGNRRIIYRIERLPYDFFKGVTFNHEKTQP